jgi:hypothetical protein
MDTARPQAIGPAQRTVPAGPATAGMVREQAFAADDRWVGGVRTETWGPERVASPWRHRHVLLRAQRHLAFEFGTGGHERMRVRAGDYVYMPHGLVHREGTTWDGPAEVALVRIGSGPPVVNVEGPESA